MQTITVLRSLLLSDFPSGSAINYHKGKLYLVGDDANRVLVLDGNYRQTDTIQLFDHPEKRIPKAVKPDYEAAAIIEAGGQSQLLIIGSASRKEREISVLIPLPVSGSGFQEPKAFSTAAFTARMLHAGIPEINIEGATAIGDRLLLANRGNHTHTQNYLLITAQDYWARQQHAPLHIISLDLAGIADGFMGVSGLCYIAAKDLLLITLTMEATTNAYDDGVIGDSYIMWVSDFSGRLSMPSLKPDGWINLPQADDRFKGQKIEGLCMEPSAWPELLLHLAADNDQGQTYLFSCLLHL
ncbi:hypothetical protein F0L74_29490 [Chitinophaga agrisoli]|uniref:Uncharacterized protein n=1 Tax=Chitinophaga agrisoli TaxID=2607653 RepID=A0A5B2VQC1_9BACT|nr:hypothetical protein [Chitinophaga agrisoli]KAA2240299.1 hypothetical protein F0L74_29490 [Chitinophaga agrisoli]